MSKNALQWIDIAILRVITEFTKKHGKPPTKYALFNSRVKGKEKPSLVNDWLKSEDVDPIYALPLSSYAALEASLTKLRVLGLLISEGSFIPTPAAEVFFGLGYIGEDWHKWPVLVPIKGNVLDFSNAEYPPEF